MKKRKWYVCEENPRPDDYIAVCRNGENMHGLDNSSTYKGFCTKHEALLYAKELLQSFQLRKIRLFFPDGHSEIIRMN